jgi:hypothetical protein
MAETKTTKDNNNANLLNFVKHISQKNYAEANKYLQEVVDSKLKAKIETASKKKLF